MLVACLIAGLLLSMNTATMDGSRALYGISQDGMTTKALGRLNRYSVPAIAMTADVILNLFLISYFGYPLDILAAGNLGYMLAHVFALTGFLLLRGPAELAAPIKLAASGADRRAARSGQPAVHRHRCVHLRGQVRLRLGQDPDRHRRARRRPAALHLAEGRGRPPGVPLREETPTMPPDTAAAAPAATPAV